MRTTFDIIRDGLSAIDTAANAMTQAQDQLATGRALRTLADDPAASARLVGAHATLGAIDAYTGASNAAAAKQSAVDSVLTDVIDKITSAITTASGARGTSVTPSMRQAAALGLQGLRDALAGDINSQFQGSYLFSGSATNQASYAQIAGVWTYQGDSNEVQASIDSGRQVNQTWDGQAIFKGGASRDVLSVIDDLTTAVSNGDTAAIGTGITELQNAFSRATSAQSRLGADERSVSDALSRLADLKNATDTLRSKDEDANMAEAATKLSQAQVAYRAALGAVGAVNQLSLLDFMK